MDDLVDISETFISRLFEQVRFLDIESTPMVGKKKIVGAGTRPKQEIGGGLPTPRSSSPDSSGRVKNPPSKKRKLVDSAVAVEEAISDFKGQYLILPVSRGEIYFLPFFL